MVWGIFKSDAVSETYKKMKAEELKGNQHKLDVDKDGKIEGEDLAKLRAQKEEVENVEEGWDDMVKYAKEKNAPQPNGGAGKKQGTRYGGSKQKDEKEVKEDVEQIDEISKKTLGSYVSKASVDMANRTADATKKKTLAGADYAHNISRGMDAKTADKHMKKDYDDAKPDVNKAVKRMHNINKAVNRLTKEDVEFDEEGNLMSNKISYKDFLTKIEEALWPGTPEHKAKFGQDQSRKAGQETRTQHGTQKGTGSGVVHTRDYDKAEKEEQPEQQKRGRGRPAGSKSGARN